MGAAVGRETDALALFTELSEATYRHDFYQTLRRLECLFEDRPRWGARGAVGVVNKPCGWISHDRLASTLGSLHPDVGAL